MNHFDAESIVLSHCLLNCGDCSDVISALSPSDFTGENANLYIELAKNKSANDVYQRSIDGYIKGWPVAKISELLDVLPMFNLPAAIKMLKDRSIRRNVLALASRIVAESQKGIDLDDLKVIANDIVLATEGAKKRGLVHIGEIVDQVLNDLKNGHKRFIRSGFESLDAMITGFFNQDFVILAARPSMGKTAFAGNLALRIASQGYPVAFFSLEMKDSAIVGRAMACASKISASRIRSGELNEYEFSKVSSGVEKLRKLPVYFDDRGGLTVSKLHGIAKEWKRKHEGRIMVVDYLQLMQGSGRSGNEIVGGISKGLKEIAKDLDIPVIALSQLSRANRDRQDKRPQLSDLRDSGAIEQDADTVIFLHRDSYYTEDRKDGPTEVIVAKQRSGPTGTITLDFDGKIQRFN